ncbi:SMP-30/gluconolactonase/LRE family protein [Xanthomonas sp. SHU 199]|uniref:SMP-30/gluconolactonase/LRE family protein n=1 Tax=Xanthomonas sp. SHU 199 TaxID=1591174 RepID=UPI00035F877E|nr:SMP-30/gluconolactonase/LRE family protein [Xanthomonas sp. SHU 199]
MNTSLPPRHTATLAVDSRCAHGEGMLWCERRGVLFWVDISGRRLWRHDPASNVSRHWDLPDRPGCLGLFDDGRLLLALAKGVYAADPDAAAEADSTLPLQHLADVEPERDDTRSNDGRADRHGNFVFGTMSEREDQAPVGSFYQWSARHGLRRLPLPGVAIPNAICFSADGRTLYYCDSVQPRILCCDYDPDSAHTANSRVFAELDHAGAEPDGAIVDAEGHLWNAQWRAWQVVRYRPDGSVERRVALPVKHPTCPALGGADGGTLYLSTSRQDHSEDELARTPQAGGVYVAAVGIAGLPEGRIASA